MGEPKPILTPGHPADLRGIIEAALNEQQAMARRDDLTRAEVRALAESVVYALQMWLGEVPVALDDGREDTRMYLPEHGTLQ